VDRLVWGRGSQDSLKLVDVGFGKIGGLICWENYMPAARLALYQLGVEYALQFGYEKYGTDGNLGSTLLQMRMIFLLG
jgi:predicted amidohydrolase